MATGVHARKGQPAPNCLSLSFSAQTHASLGIRRGSERFPRNGDLALLLI